MSGAESTANSASAGASALPRLDATCFGTPVAPVAGVLNTVPEPGGRVEVGGWLGRFLLAEKLGEGAMGEVYRGEDSQSGDSVAIKVISGFLVRRADVLRRFQQEASLLARIDNPHVVRLLEVGEERGRHFLVMELVAGGSMRRLLDERGPLPEAVAIGVMTDVAAGLADAHGHGVVHRDIKPENLLLLAPPPPGPLGDDVQLAVKVSDFGTARAIGPSLESCMTMAGAIVGTPLYMSPEQCTGNSPLGPGIDVYAMGVALFELLAGATPFRAEDLVQLATMHCFDPPPALKSIRPELSDGVVRVVEKALAKTPEARYASAAEFHADLTALAR